MTIHNDLSVQLAVISQINGVLMLFCVLSFSVSFLLHTLQQRILACSTQIGKPEYARHTTHTQTKKHNKHVKLEVEASEH